MGIPRSEVYGTPFKILALFFGVIFLVGGLVASWSDFTTNVAGYESFGWNPVLYELPMPFTEGEDGKPKYFSVDAYLIGGIVAWSGLGLKVWFDARRMQIKEPKRKRVESTGPDGQPSVKWVELRDSNGNIIQDVVGWRSIFTQGWRSDSPQEMQSLFWHRLLVIVINVADTIMDVVHRISFQSMKADGFNGAEIAEIILCFGFSITVFTFLADLFVVGGLALFFLAVGRSSNLPFLERQLAHQQRKKDIRESAKGWQQELSGGGDTSSRTRQVRPQHQHQHQPAPTQRQHQPAPTHTPVPAMQMHTTTAHDGSQTRVNRRPQPPTQPMPHRRMV